MLIYDDPDTIRSPRRNSLSSPLLWTQGPTSIFKWALRCAYLYASWGSWRHRDTPLRQRGDVIPDHARFWHRRESAPAASIAQFTRRNFLLQNSVSSRWYPRHMCPFPQKLLDAADKNRPRHSIQDAAILSRDSCPSQVVTSASNFHKWERI